MPKNINSASRLNLILGQASGMADNVPTLTVWSSLFQIEEANDVRKALEVSERLRWLHQELDILHTQMRGANISEEIYAPAFNRIEQAVSTLLLTTTWNNVKQYLGAETLIAFAFCAEILPDEESQINSQEIEEIRSQVHELQGLLKSSTLPDSLKTLIRHHIELIQRALDQYPIIGAKALREAARTALGELIEAKDTVLEANKTEEVSRLGAIWKKINDSADVAIKTDKIAKIGTKAWTFLENIIT